MLRQKELAEKKEAED
jgi:hypothetical protein